MKFSSDGADGRERDGMKGKKRRACLEDIPASKQ